MRQRKTVCALLALALLPLGGCSDAKFLPRVRELDEVDLLRTLGVDAAKEGVEVTASGGVQRKGANSGEEPPVVLTRTAPTLSSACTALQSAGEKYFFFGHVGQLLAGEELVRRGLDEIMDYMTRDPEMRLDTQLYVVRGGSAADAVARPASGGKDSATAQLEALTDSAALAAIPPARTVRDVLGDTVRCGATYCPAVELFSTGKEGEDTLASGGYAILKNSRLVGWAEGDAERGVGLLLGKPETEILEFTGPAGEKVSLRVVGARTSVRGEFDGQRIAGLAVSCTAEANVAQTDGKIDFSAGVPDWLTGALAAAARKRIQAAVNTAQTLDADYLDLCRRVGMTAPWRWAALKQQWSACFSTLKVSVATTGVVKRSYNAK